LVVATRFELSFVLYCFCGSCLRKTTRASLIMAIGNQLPRLQCGCHWRTEDGLQSVWIEESTNVIS
jgi:hypothetical protein